MMRLPAFTYRTPRTSSEAARILADSGSAAAVVAGGTDVYPAMKRRQTTADVLVGLRRIDGLRGIRHGGGRIEIGAMTPLREVAAAEDLAPALTRAASLVSSPQIRNAATVGGNLCLETRCSWYDVSEGVRRSVGPCLKAGGDTCWLAPSGDRCWAVAASDLAPVAVALDAEVHLTGVHGDRVASAAGVYTGDGLAPLARSPDEIVTKLVVPPADGLRSTYWKLARRGAIDFPDLGVAVAVRLSPSGVVSHARIVLGAVASAPVRAVEAEHLLTGVKPTRETIEEAGLAAARTARPLGNTDLPHYHRKWVIPVAVSRALREVTAVAT